MASGRRWVALLLLAAASCAHAARAEPTGDDYDPYELSLPDTRGQPVSLGDYRGKLLVVNFFATWCFPCLGLLPLLIEAQQKDGAAGLQVVGIGLDREAELVLEPFREFYRIPYPILVGADRFAEPGLPLGPIHTLPTTVVISRSGRILARWEGVLPRPLLDAMIAHDLAR